jgi:hypothetical protein
VFPIYSDPMLAPLTVCDGEFAALPGASSEFHVTLASPVNVPNGISTAVPFCAKGRDAVK